MQATRIGAGGSDIGGSGAVRWQRMFAPIAVFLTVFGVLNFVELPLGWKDRTEQFTRYLDATVGLGSGWVMPLLWLTKSVELSLGLVAAGALVFRRIAWLQASVAGWMTVFTGFTVMDIWAADRAELQEHTVYFAMFAMLLCVTWVVSAVVATSDRVAAIGDDRSGVAPLAPGDDATDLAA